MSNYKKNKKSIEYRLLKRKHKLLLKDWQDIDRNKYKYDRTLKRYITEEGILNRVLQISPYLKMIYYSVQLYYDFNRENEFSCPSREIKASQLDCIIQEYRTSEYQLLNEAGRTLNRWKEQLYQKDY